MKRILCYGDSNTYGCNPAWVPEWDLDAEKSVRLPASDRWTRILGQLLGGEYEIIEEGLPGRTTVFPDPLYPHCDGRTALLPTLLSQAPVDIVLIMLGTNDLKVTFTPCIDTCKRGMEELVKMILNPFLWEHQKVPKVLIVAPPVMRDNIENSNFYGMYDRSSVELSKGLGSAYAAVAKAFGCAFLDASCAAEASELDCVHMNAENHRKLAEALAKVISSL